ncbi:hypothetical protein BDV25DRAFT_68979 [Aspergillus avenaceus]|uniref:Uncharacterized protein n=1 Tax=Aspergillus avenaceus TaxID=36643 RepID=A0A5N6TGS6_ASPAV|nr:hypothetical protein BDV25DRAFT_68979 [Aspergillus avenaceus]
MIITRNTTDITHFFELHHIRYALDANRRLKKVRVLGSSTFVLKLEITNSHGMVNPLTKAE